SRVHGVPAGAVGPAGRAGAAGRAARVAQATRAGCAPVTSQVGQDRVGRYRHDSAGPVVEQQLQADGLFPVEVTREPVAPHKPRPDELHVPQVGAAARLLHRRRRDGGKKRVHALLAQGDEQVAYTAYRYPLVADQVAPGFPRHRRQRGGNVEQRRRLAGRHGHQEVGADHLLADKKVHQREQPPPGQLVTDDQHLQVLKEDLPGHPLLQVGQGLRHRAAPGLGEKEGRALPSGAAWTHAQARGHDNLGGQQDLPGLCRVQRQEVDEGQAVDLGALDAPRGQHCQAQEQRAPCRLHPGDRLAAPAPPFAPPLTERTAAMRTMANGRSSCMQKEYTGQPASSQASTSCLLLKSPSLKSSTRPAKGSASGRLSLRFNRRARAMTVTCCRIATLMTVRNSQTAMARGSMRKKPPMVTNRATDENGYASRPTWSPNSIPAERPPMTMSASTIPVPAKAATARPRSPRTLAKKNAMTMTSPNQAAGMREARSTGTTPRSNRGRMSCGCTCAAAAAVTMRVKTICTGTTIRVVRPMISSPCQEI